jgi:glycosyltransferase involved in cell wall biosynthesis
MKADVTIGIPVYNSEKYISGALDGVINQSYKNFKVIISDNASTDNTAEICRKYSAKDNRIEVIVQEQTLDVISNFNFLLKNAETPFFIWLAADDRWEPQFLEKTLSVLKSNSDCGLVFSDFIIKNHVTEESVKRDISSRVSNVPFIRFIFSLIDMQSNLVYGLFRTEYLKQKGLSNFDYADVDLILDLSVRKKIRIIDDYLFTAGIKGKRNIYSLTGSKVNKIYFIKRQILRAYREFGALKSIFTALLLSIWYFKKR